MQGLELLQAIVADLEPGSADGALPPDALRFIIEYDERRELEPERQRIAALIGTSEFELEALFDDEDGELDDEDDEFGWFAVLQFPTLDRTLSHRHLFDIAYDLGDELGAVTVEPELGAKVYDDPLPPGAEPEGFIGDLFSRTCWVEVDAPVDKTWALDTMRVREAWDIAGGKGGGILIGQPDTGVTVHLELDEVAVAAELGDNYIESGTDPTDPLDSGASNPGHGTGTSSVVISGDGGQMIGSSPEARLVPIRCIDDVKVFNGAPVAKAIDHARAVGCRVVTMSLGGTPSRAVRKAARRAVRNGLIVLAAAGNCLRLVVFPARYRDVIAVAGCNQAEKSWKGSSRGGSVDITAPGELVWKAATSDSGADIQGGQGTSFAVALTSGVAALWLAHHGPDVIDDAAAAAGLSVQALFREAIKRAARQPAGGWDTGDYGAGIVDAAALLQLDLDELVGGPSIEAAAAAAPAETDAMFLEVFGDRIDLEGSTTDWRRYELEIGATMLEDARLGFDSADGLESLPATVQLSGRLRAEIEAADQPALGKLDRGRGSQPALRAGDDGRDPTALVVPDRERGVAATTRRAARSARSVDTPAIDARLDTLSRRLEGVREAAGAGPEADELPRLHDELLRDGEEVLHRISRGEAVPGTTGQQAAVEALVLLDGRPSIRLTDDGIDLDDPELGMWQGSIGLCAPELEQSQRSVGRVDDGNGVHHGTGFVVGPDLVMTNRHVLEGLAFPIPHKRSPARWVVDGEPTINFSPGADDPTGAFRIVDVAFAGIEPIDGVVRLENLDLAVLRVEPTNDAGGAVPAPLPISTDATRTAEDSQLFVIGYPARPTTLPTDTDGRTRLDVIERLRQIYGMAYGVRYLSPGMVDTAAADLAGSPMGWTFTHDATSLGGNSGSCVLSADDGSAVVGLHFAGDWLRANFAHDMGVAFDTIRDVIG